LSYAPSPKDLLNVKTLKGLNKVHIVKSEKMKNMHHSVSDHNKTGLDKSISEKNRLQNVLFTRHEEDNFIITSRAIYQKEIAKQRNI
jgi:hypothetical protein